MTKAPNPRTHSLFATDKRAREAQHRSVVAIWLALMGWIMGGIALAAEIVERFQ